ncbi:MAG: TIM barrel protein [Candidatus Bathyarchaeia archaeon]|nr:TIM barrel protein [Candidatus Bathyarchaeota archaeon]
MRDFSEKLSKFKGFITGSQIDEFFKEFDIKFGAGVWAAGDFSDRFNRTGYFPEMPSDLKSKLKRIHEAGIEGAALINAQFVKSDYTVDWNLVNEAEEYMGELKLKPAGLALDLSGFPKWKLGTLTNPDTRLREDALNNILESLEIAKQLKTDVASLWPGQDGWDYSLEVDYGKRLDWLYEGCLTIAKRAKQLGLTFSVEAKIKEPKEGNMIIPTSQFALLLAKSINRELDSKVMGITIDYGHELMYAVEPAFTVYAAKKFEVPLAAFHINTAKTHSNDEDRIVGTGDFWAFIDFLYAAIDVGYNGWMVLDQFSYRMDPVEALRLSKEFFANFYKKALAIYGSKDEFEKIRDTGDQARILHYIKGLINQ